MSLRGSQPVDHQDDSSQLQTMAKYIRTPPLAGLTPLTCHTYTNIKFC